MIYSLATLVMFIMCALARLITPDADRIARAAAWVVFFTGLGRLVGYYTDPPLSMLHYVLVDYLMMVLSYGWWQVRGEKWAWTLGTLFLCQLCGHMLFWASRDEANVYNYIVYNNGLFVLELSVLSIAGGSYVGGWIRDRLLLLRRRSSHILANRAQT